MFSLLAISYVHQLGWAAQYKRMKLSHHHRFYRESSEKGQTTLKMKTNRKPGYGQKKVDREKTTQPTFNSTLFLLKYNPFRVYWLSLNLVKFNQKAAAICWLDCISHTTHVWRTHIFHKILWSPKQEPFVFVFVFVCLFLTSWITFYRCTHILFGEFSQSVSGLFPFIAVVAFLVPKSHFVEPLLYIIQTINRGRHCIAMAYV